MKSSLGGAAPTSANPDAVQARLARRDKLDASRARVSAHLAGTCSKKIPPRSQGHSAAGEKDTLKQQRMLRNRESAALSRRRNEALIKCLEAQVEALEEKNRRLRLQLTQFTDVGDKQLGGFSHSATSTSYTSGGSDVGGYPAPGTSFSRLESTNAENTATAAYTQDGASRGFQDQCRRQHLQQTTKPLHSAAPQFFTQVPTLQSEERQVSYGGNGMIGIHSEGETYLGKYISPSSSTVSNETVSWSPRIDVAFNEPMTELDARGQEDQDAISTECKCLELSQFLEQMTDG